MALTLYFYPRCTGCRQAKAFLAGEGIQVKERLYVTDPPTREELVALSRVVEGGVHGLISQRSRRVAQKGLDLAALSEEEILDLLVAEPILLRRPILTDGARAVVGSRRAALAQFIAEGGPAEA